MSLRGRLLATTLVLCTIGLVAADAATYGFLSRFLTRRVDQQLPGLVGPASRALFEGNAFGSITPPPGTGAGGGGFGGANGLRPRTVIPFGAYAELRDEVGKPQGDPVWFGNANEQRPAPPELATVLNPPAGGDIGPYSAPAVRGAGRYRVYVTHTGRTQRTIVVAIPLTEVAETLRQLVYAEASVTLLVLAGILGLSWWAVRRGLRPLERMGDTAAAIAAGDLSRRVAPADERTEVGRLGLSLNAMLTQIEEAFAERQESEDRLRRFVADASHELRTPLTSIRGYAELFRQGARSHPEDLEKAMRRIEDEAAHMGVLVEEMLLLARLDQGRPLEREPVDLSGLVADACDDLRTVDSTRPVDVDIAPGVEVRGDRAALKQVVGNLLANARVHTPPGTPVRVRLTPEDGTAKLVVADEGPGLPPDGVDRVFERFYRADPSRTRSTGGSGLGLSIVAAIVAAHGGSVDVTSEPGRGATFTVTLRSDGGPGPAETDPTGTIPIDEPSYI